MYYTQDNFVPGLVAYVPSLEFGEILSSVGLNDSHDRKQPNRHQRSPGHFIGAGDLVVGGSSSPDIIGIAFWLSLQCWTY